MARGTCASYVGSCRRRHLRGVGSAGFAASQRSTSSPVERLVAIPVVLDDATDDTTGSRSRPPLTVPLESSRQAAAPRSSCGKRAAAPVRLAARGGPGRGWRSTSRAACRRSTMLARGIADVDARARSGAPLRRSSAPRLARRLRRSATRSRSATHPLFVAPRRRASSHASGRTRRSSASAAPERARADTRGRPGRPPTGYASPVDERRATPPGGSSPSRERLRVLGGLDTGLLWGNLGVSLLVIVAGAILVPALSLPEALVAIVVGCLVGNLMLASRRRSAPTRACPAMVLMRAPLGQRGSLPADRRSTSCRASAGRSSSCSSSRPPRPRSRTSSSGSARSGCGRSSSARSRSCSRCSARSASSATVRPPLRDLGVPLAVVYLDLVGARRRRPRRALGRAGRGRPLASGRAPTSSSASRSRGSRSPPTTRASRRRGAARSGAPALGYFVPDAWLLALGAVLVLSRDLARPGRAPGGGRRRRARRASLALFALTRRPRPTRRSRTRTPAPSRSRTSSRARRSALLVVATTALATVGALVDRPRRATRGSCSCSAPCFVPLFAVLLADWLAAGRALRRATTSSRPAPVRSGLIAAWVAGFALYQWLYPTGPSWWVDLVAAPRPARLGHRRDGAELRRRRSARARRRGAAHSRGSAAASRRA